MYNNLKIGYNIYENLYVEEINEIKIFTEPTLVLKVKIRCNNDNKDFRHMSYKHKVKNSKKYSKPKIDIKKIMFNI